MKQDVFISYSFEDKREADQILIALESQGIHCWIAPRDIIPGTSWAESIVEAISNSRLLVVLLTDHSKNSPQVLREIERASSEKLTIIAVKRNEGSISKSMIYFLGTHQWFDATDTDLQAQLPNLVTAVRNGLTTESHLLVDNSRAHVRSPEDDLLSDRTEEEFGGGERLISTGFLVYGILTLWIYSVITFCRYTEKHINTRRRTFLDKIEIQDVPDQNRKNLEAILDRGFHVKKTMKVIPVILFSISYCLVVAEILSQHLFAYNLLSEKMFNMFAISSVSVASLLFFSGSIYFVMGAFRTVKSHEYNELLLFEFSRNPLLFKMMSPSVAFQKKWNKMQNYITLFLIFSLPLIVSATLGVVHIIKERMEVGGYGITAINEAFVLWVIVISICSVIFHYWGTKLILKLFNDHLETEVTYLRIHSK